MAPTDPRIDTRSHDRTEHPTMRRSALPTAFLSGLVTTLLLATSPAHPQPASPVPAEAPAAPDPEPAAQPAAAPPPAPQPLATGSVSAPPVAPVQADTLADMPTAAPAVPAAQVDSCATVSDRAMASDLRAAQAQAQKADATQFARLVDESIALWTLAVQRCEGRGQERARRNLADSERSRQALATQLGASPACTAGQKDAGSLQDLAQQAVRERRWLDAAVLYRKAENMWDVTAERCAGEAQQTALQRRDQTATDAHNAEHCAPVFEQARNQSQALRRAVGDRASPEKQTHSQAAETLWREALNQCRGAAQDVARSNADQIARDRGTPWVATAAPGAPVVMARAAPPAPTPAPAPAAVGRATASTSAPPALVSSLASDSAATAAQSAAAPAAAGPGLFQSLSKALTAPVTAVVAAVSPAAASGPQDMDLQAGDTRFVGRFVREGASLTGQGQIRWANGDQYEGDIVQGRRHGQGRLLWASGQRYEGPWVNDQPQGKGQMRFANGDEYEGEVAQGLPSGQGRMRYASGDTFDGRFAGGKPDGQGVYRWASGQRYEGPWANDQPHGNGRLQFANGNVWEGPLQAGSPEGQGTLSFASGERYEGGVSKGLPHGEGRYRWTNGDQYSGQWQQGRKHGKGRMQWANGDAWEGRFENDGQSAEGTLTRKGG